jgi:hypothetical protein
MLHAASFPTMLYLLQPHRKRKAQPHFLPLTSRVVSNDRIRRFHLFSEADLADVQGKWSASSHTLQQPLRTSLKSGFRMSGKISVQVVICLEDFQSLVSELPDDAKAKAPAAQLWQDALARFRIWSSNIGAHQKGQSSLDYRLRDASHIRDQILTVLDALHENLLDAKDVVVEGALDEGDEDSASELDEVYSGIQKLLECLFQLSMRIRRPALRDKVLGRRKDDSTDFEDFDRRHIRDKFPEASDVLVDRLTTAISKRRSNLKYFERHHTKLGKGIEVPDNSAGDESATFYSSTIATTFRENQLDAIDKAPISYASVTSYAPSLFSGDSHVTIPPVPPESADGSPFECPYCYLIITVSSPRDWAKHIFQDLEPYVCVIEDCSMPERLYKSRHEWTAHLRDSHQQSLGSSRCPLCTEDCVANPQLQQHLRRHLEDLALFILPAADTTAPIQDPENVESDLSSHGSDDGECRGHIDVRSCKHCDRLFDFTAEDDGTCTHGRHESGSVSASQFPWFESFPYGLVQRESFSTDTPVHAPLEPDPTPPLRRVTSSEQRAFRDLVRRNQQQRALRDLVRRNQQHRQALKDREQRRLSLAGLRKDDIARGEGLPEKRDLSKAAKVGVKTLVKWAGFGRKASQEDSREESEEGPSIAVIGRRLTYPTQVEAGFNLGIGHG